MNYSKSKANASGSYKRNDTDGMVAEMLQKYTFIFNIFLSKKLYISILSQKNIFVSKNFVIQRKYIYIQSKYIKKMLFNWIFFHINNISLFSEKKNVFNEIFLFNEFSLVKSGLPFVCEIA